VWTENQRVALQEGPGVNVKRERRTGIWNGRGVKGVMIGRTTYRLPASTTTTTIGFISVAQLSNLVLETTICTGIFSLNVFLLPANRATSHSKFELDI
jgi:hypothetical protein